MTPEEIAATAARIVKAYQGRQGGTRHVDAEGRHFPLGRGKQNPGSPSFNVIHSRGEQSYSLTRVIRALAEGDPTLAPFEFDMSKRLEHAGYPCSPKSILVPLGDEVLYRNPGYESVIDDVAKEFTQSFPIPGRLDLAEAAALQRKYIGKALDPLDDTAGGALVDMSRGDFIGLLRAAEIFSRAGARTVPLTGPMSFPRETGDPTFQWIPANTTITESTDLTGQLLLIPKSAKGLVKVPNELARYAGGVAEALVRNALVQRAARTLDLALLEGSGGTLTPQGLVNYARSANNTPTADKVTLHVAGTTGAAGDTFLAKDVLTMLSLIEEAPDPDGASAWVMRPMMFNGLANLRAHAVTGGDAAGVFMFPFTRGNLGSGVEKVLSGIPVLTSTTVSNTRTKGSGTTLSYILTGNFQRFLIGRVGVAELALSYDVGFGADQIWIRCVIRVDGGPTHPHAFSVCDSLVIPT